MRDRTRTPYRIVEDDLHGDEIQALLRRHAEGMLASSPPGACHFFDLDGLRDDDVTVWSAWDGPVLAGCGALLHLDDTHGEIKSMRTADDHLGRGVGRRVLDHIVSVAVDRGYRRLSLETGSGAAFDPAIRLYETSGFVPCGPFGEYRAGEFSRFYTRDLTLTR
jgi:putative acetyltransferase